MDAKTISLRVTAREASDIERLAKTLGLTQSDVLKRGLAALRDQLQEERSSYEVGRRSVRTPRQWPRGYLDPAPRALQGSGTCEARSSIAAR